MSAPPSDTTWKAEEHTLAKIAILRAYLQAWFAILGRSVGQDMLYIDGVLVQREKENQSRCLRD